MAAGLSAFVGYGVLNWAPAFLMRDKGMSLQQIGVFYSLLIGVSGGVGLWLSGWMVDRLAPKRPGIYALAPGIAILVSLPFFLAALRTADWRTAMLLLIAPATLLPTYLSPAIAAVQNSVRAARRATAGSLLLLIMNVVGLGGGPVFVGALSDHFKAAGAGHPLTVALTWLTPAFLLAVVVQGAAACLLQADRRDEL